MYQKLLVPLDGSAFAETALSAATHVARNAGASIILATVREPLTAMVYQEWMTSEGSWEEAYLEEVAAKLGAESGVEMTTVLLSGRVDESLDRHAAEEGVDLIVLATHGRGPLTRSWLGSTADGLVRRSRIPVLLTRPSEDGSEAGEARHTFERVLVPLDGSELSERALEPALALGGLDDASFTLLRIVQYPAGLASPYLPDTVTLNRQLVEEARERAQAYLETTASKLREKGVEVATEVQLEPQPGTGIIHFARDHEIDLIAMATHGRGGVSRVLLGSVADKVLRGSHAPLLLVRPEEE